MEEARRWHVLRPRELPGRDQAFLDAVFALARRGQRTRRTALVGAFVLMGAIAAGALVAFIWIRGAEHQASENFGRAELALDKMQQKERERLAAEQRQAMAEKQKAVAEAEVQIKTAEVEESREELKAKNAKLETALKDAERQRAKAEKTAVDLEAAKTKVNVYSGECDW